MCIHSEYLVLSGLNWFFVHFPMRPVYGFGYISLSLLLPHCAATTVAVAAIIVTSCLVSSVPFWTHHRLQLCNWLELQAAWTYWSPPPKCSLFSKTDEHLNNNNQNCVYFSCHRCSHAHNHRARRTAYRLLNRFPFSVRSFLQFYFIVFYSLSWIHVKLCSGFIVRILTFYISFVFSLLFTVLLLFFLDVCGGDGRRKWAVIAQNIYTNKFQFSVSYLMSIYSENIQE